MAIDVDRSEIRCGFLGWNQLILISKCTVLLLHLCNKVQIFRMEPADIIALLLHLGAHCSFEKRYRFLGQYLLVDTKVLLLYLGTHHGFEIRQRFLGYYQSIPEYFYCTWVPTRYYEIRCRFLGWIYLILQYCTRSSRAYSVAIIESYKKRFQNFEKSL